MLEPSLSNTSIFSVPYMASVMWAALNTIFGGHFKQLNHLKKAETDEKHGTKYTTERILFNSVRADIR